MRLKFQTPLCYCPSDFDPFEKWFMDVHIVAILLTSYSLQPKKVLRGNIKTILVKTIESVLSLTCRRFIVRPNGENYNRTFLLQITVEMFHGSPKLPIVLYSKIDAKLKQVGH